MTKEEMLELRTMIKEVVSEELDGKLDKKLEPIQSEISSLKGDISSLKGDVSSLKGDISSIKGDVSSLKADVAHLNHTIVPALTLLQEGMDGINERFQRQDRLEEKIDSHDDRIFALEQERITK